MGPLKELIETGKEALTVKRYFYIGLIFTVFTLAATWIPLFEWHGRPIFLNVPGWTWGVMGVFLALAWFFLKYANTQRLELVPKIGLFFDNSCIVETPEKYSFKIPYVINGDFDRDPRKKGSLRQHYC